MGVMETIARGVFLRGMGTGLLRAGTGLADSLHPNATRQLELGHAAFVAAQGAAASEFRSGRTGWFDAFVNGLNRLPRPMLALGTLGLFIYAMVDPSGFSRRMAGLHFVPEPLWWLLGAIVAFYFGARETHYLREHRPVTPTMTAPDNPALRAWQDAAAREDFNVERG